MTEHAAEIISFLQEKLAGVQRLAVLGAGSVLRADDAAGVQVVEALQDQFTPAQYPDVLLCVGETAPENYCGKISAFNPTHLIVVDAADLGKEAGMVVEIRPQDVGGPTFCSHMLPLRVTIDYIVQHTGTAVILLGIQYQSIAFDGEMTQPVNAAVEALTQGLSHVMLGRWGGGVGTCS